MTISSAPKLYRLRIIGDANGIVIGGVVKVRYTHMAKTSMNVESKKIILI